MPSKRAYRMLAEPQFGAVGRDQLLAVGFSRRAIDHLVATGELSHGYSGTYLVSGTPRTHLQRLFKRICGRVKAPPSRIVAPEHSGGWTGCRTTSSS